MHKTKTSNKNKVNNSEKENFFSWYFHKGIHGMFEIWLNFISFFWSFFSIGELIFTLFSPWKKDISFRTWRGWHPEKALHLFINNIFSRIIGMIVRSIVIFSGLVITFATIVAGFSLIFIWIAFPVIALVAYFTLGNFVSLALLVGCVVFWMLLLFFFYWTDKKTSIFYIQFDRFFNHAIFKRICARMGISEKEFPYELLENAQAMESFLRPLNLTFKDFQQLMIFEFDREHEISNRKKFWRRENLDRIAKIGSQWRYGYTIHLDEYVTDLSLGDYSEYKKTKLIGRDDEFEMIKLILQRPDQNCVLLTGPSGIGKKTCIHNLAKSIRENEIEGFIGTRVLLLDLGRVISDSINQGRDVENVIRLLLHEAAFAGNVILVIEHIEHFIGRQENVFHPDLSAVISEYLSIPSLQIIATSTPKEYHQLIEQQGEIVKYFEVVEMREPQDEDVIKILMSKLETYESKRIIFSFQALRLIVANSNKYNWEFPMPERAIDLAMDVLTYWSKKSQNSLITENVVSEFLTLKTGIPQGEIDVVERKKLLDLESLLHKFVIGQEEAVKEIAEALRRARSGIGNSNKPIGSFLFLGPTGVGKTETAKALARAYFGDENRMVRLDMSEFQSPGSIDRLIGSSQLNQQGRLVTQIKDNPYTLLLLDEIEKAYPEILDIFLQILDEGFVTDAFGEKVNFRNTIIIATSNAGSVLIKDMVNENKDPAQIKQALVDYTVSNSIFRVEFLNRFSDVIFFRPLMGNELQSVTKLLLDKFSRKLSVEKNIEISFEESVIDKVIEKGYNPIFGARSIDRYIEKSVEDLVATKIIAGEVKSGERISISL